MKILEKLKNLIKKDTFHIVLFICICLVAASGVWVSKNNYNISKRFNQNKNDNHQEIEIDLNLNMDKDIAKKAEEARKVEEARKAEQAEQAKKAEQAKVAEQSRKAEEAKKVEETKKLAQNKETQEQVQATSVQVEVQNKKMQAPLKGNISMKFSKDEPIYCEVLEQWSTYNGIDIQASEGTSVLAAMDGTVKEVRKDEKLGVFITIDHGNGLQTKYSNLSITDTVKKGQNLKAGDTIGKLSKSTGFRKLKEPHLYFEVVENNQYVDPKNFIAEFK